MTIQDIKDLAEAFQSLAIGIGALFSAATFAPALLKTFNHNKIVNKYKKDYPAGEIDEIFSLVNNPHRGKGHVYLLDTRTMTSHHIENPETMRDLLFDWGQVKDIDITHYDKYKASHNIDTKVE